MIKQYFTFMQSDPQKNCYVEIEAESTGAAREEMFRRYGTKWAFQYNSAEEAGVKMFNLRKVD